MVMAVLQLRYSSLPAVVAFFLPILLSHSVSAQQAEAVNRGVVEIETSGSAGMSVRMVEDLANLIDDGATRRVLPVVGKGALQMLVDLKYLRGIDMAILPLDVLEYAKAQRLYPGIESSLTYITKLHNEEFHLLTRPEIKVIADLKERKVNVDLQGSGTSITAARLFDMLKIPVAVTHDTQEVALDKLRRGEIAAVAFVAGKPAPVFASMRREQGIHFLAVPVNAVIASSYIPTRLSRADYPELIPEETPVETIAVGNVLAVTELRQLRERSRNVANFVDIFFTGFQSLLTPGHHPKWNEVNLATELPGWRRYAPADQWLRRNMQIVKTPSPEVLQTMFSRFLDERRQAIGQGAMSQQDKDALFQQFQSWQREQPR
jgi:TRAP-type uncharacterized transport system substrate-binding protein